MEPEWSGGNATSLQKTGTLDLALFKAIIQKVKAGNKEAKLEEIRNLLSLQGLIMHYRSRDTDRVIISDCLKFEYPHEFHTAKKLAEVNYDVLFVPKGYFKRSEKKFDVFLLRDNILLEVELKCINSEKANIIGNRIMQGSDQSSKIVLDVHSRISKKDLIDGLKAGCLRNNIISEILLFYSSHFYRLRKNVILSRKIFDIIK